MQLVMNGQPDGKYIENLDTLWSYLESCRAAVRVNPCTLNQCTLLQPKADQRLWRMEFSG